MWVIAAGTFCWLSPQAYSSGNMWTGLEGHAGLKKEIIMDSGDSLGWTYATETQSILFF